MSNLKQCQRCHKVKDTTEYSKCKSNKDGLQYCCKSCNKQTNLKFRTEINPQHHKVWQDNNWDKFIEYHNRYRKADKTGIIYSITNPDGFEYIGMSMMNFSVRLLEHRQHYKRALKGKRQRLCKLHDSFDRFGIENHEFKVIKKCPGLSREQLRQVESAFIKINKFKNISLNSKN
jgi:hypothetical protein